MVGVVIHLEDRWNYTQSDRDMDIMQMFQETVKGLGVDLFVIVDRTTDGMVHKLPTASDIEYASFGTLTEALQNYPDYERIYFEHPNAVFVESIALDELVHPADNVLYIFGGDETGLSITRLGSNEQMVSINISRYILWSIVAMTIALYDRFVRIG